MKELTTKQQVVFDFIVNFKNIKFTSPSFREIAEGTHYKHVNSIFQIIKSLEKLGYIRVEGRRNIDVLKEPHVFDEEDYKVFQIPLLGSVSAGLPLFTEAGQSLGFIPASAYFVENPRDVFFVRVNGDSMIEANIQHDDLLLVRRTGIARHRDIVIALVNQSETTCKRLMLEDGQMYLKAENPNYTNIFGEQIEVQGVVEKLIRNHI